MKLDNASRNQPIQRAHKHGFTLIELSLVITIIGLLIGGVFIANDLIRQFKLKAVLKQMEEFQTAILTFRVKYNGLPGDIANASTFFGLNPGCVAGTQGIGTQTCDGNGNGAIELVGPSQVPPREQFYIWQQLSAAGFISGKYTGLADGYAACVVGVNCPAGKLSQNQAYYIATSTPSPVSHWWPHEFATAIVTGAISTSNPLLYPAWPILSPQEAFALDSKADDGRPGLGYWRTNGPMTGSYSADCAVNETTLLNVTDAEAEQSVAIYNPTRSDLLCNILMYLRIMS